MNKSLMAANWKMYKTRAQAVDFINRFQTLLSGSDLPDIVICPPYTALDAVGKALKTPAVTLGAQTMAAQKEGAFTGDIAPGMLQELNVQYVILGHSERRQYHHESDQDIHEKLKTALEYGFTPIVCVGESLQQRESGQTDAWIQGQVEAVLAGISVADRQKLVFAYEPIWAIGTGKVCDAGEANRVIGLIRGWIQVPETRVLYGGSMKPDNVTSLMGQPEIDGGLVGGASLEPESFFQLVQAATPCMSK